MTTARQPAIGEVVHSLHRYWLSVHPAPGVLPARGRFDPLELPAELLPALPHLWLLDVERGPLRFRLRLIGSALKAAGSPAQPGDYLDEVEGHEPVSRRMAQVCESRRPSYRRGRPITVHDSRIAELENIVLPLAADGSTVDMLLCCTVYDWTAGFGPLSTNRAAG